MIDIYYSHTGSNSYVMYNDNNEGFLVDPGFNPNNALIDHLKKINVKIVGILITHGHYDHIHSLKSVCEMYPDAKVYISYDEKDFLTDIRLNLSGNHDEIGIVDYLPKNLITVVDGDVFDVSGFNIKVIATPFHTIGSVCYYVEDEKALFTGDTLFYTTIGRSDLPTGSSKTINSSLSKLIKLPEGIKVYPGHGVVTTLDREKKYNSYLRNI